MYTLGINAVYHDSAAALLRDGVVLAAAEDERFTHIKHAKRPVPFSTWQLPFDAIDYCLKAAGIGRVEGVECMIVANDATVSFSSVPCRRSP